jgi:hypothetical protein
MASNDFWIRWHQQYDDPESPRSKRLAAVQHQLTLALDEVRPGPIRLISMCAGQGRDVLGVLPEHPRVNDVRALLVELSPELTDDARSAAALLGLNNVEVSTADASWTSAYAHFVPADIILCCGVSGSISSDDMVRTARELPHMSAAGAHVIWTMEGRPPDRRPWMKQIFAEAGFEEVGYETAEGALFGVGRARWSAEPLPFRPDIQMFVFRERE